jgi:serine/threonine-protein kinase HipA
MKALVFNNNIEAATLERTKDGFIFTYLDDYFKDSARPAVSLSFPKNQKQYHSKYLFPFFSGLLAEGYNKEVQCRTLKIDENDEFTRLVKTARTETIGAITVREIL